MITLADWLEQNPGFEPALPLEIGQGRRLLAVLARTAVIEDPYQDRHLLLLEAVYLNSDAARGRARIPPGTWRHPNAAMARAASRGRASFMENQAADEDGQ